MYRYVLAVCKISIGMYRSELVCIGQYHSVFLYISPLVPCNCHICQVPGQWRPAARSDSMVYSAFNTGAVYRLQHWRSQHLQHWRRGLHTTLQRLQGFNTGSVRFTAPSTLAQSMSPHRFTLVTAYLLCPYLSAATPPWFPRKWEVILLSVSALSYL